MDGFLELRRGGTTTDPLHQARALEATKDFAGAAMAYSDARYGSGHVPASLGLLRVQVRNLGDFDGAVTIADELIRRGIESFELFMHTGFALGAMEQNEAAAGAFARAAEIDPTSGLTFYNLACCRARSGDTEGALDALRHSCLGGRGLREHLHPSPLRRDRRLSEHVLRAAACGA
jgi:tetratricopeptide (TPR) repeat protein